MRSALPRTIPWRASAGVDGLGVRAPAEAVGCAERFSTRRNTEARTRARKERERDQRSILPVVGGNGPNARWI